ncbi:uncharacterized protein [Dysidea avara]|uniref:uncharacterized protein isoform X2 n=1 Tax=Dysidea avara TaxID=196820 RepID=UPI0033169217
MSNSRGLGRGSRSRDEGNLLLIVEAANILEGRRSSNVSGNNPSNDCICVGSRNRKRKLHKAQAPTTVESLEVDVYAVNIKRVENPFAKDDEDSDDDTDDVFCHIPELEFHSTKSVSHAKMVHNAKEKKRRRSLKQAQLALHQELQPYSHQKPILKTILCTAVEEIKKLKHIAEENENCLSALKGERNFLEEKLKFLKSLDNFPKHKEEYSNDDNNDNHKCDDSTGQQSVKCDCLLNDEERDYTQSNFSEKCAEQNQSLIKDCEQMIVEDNQDCVKEKISECLWSDCRRARGHFTRKQEKILLAVVTSYHQIHYLLLHSIIHNWLHCKLRPFNWLSYKHLQTPYGCHHLSGPI